jgi:tetratricopeptide (TPR) repeat protein
MRGVISVGIVLAVLAAPTECLGQTALDLRQKAVAFEQAGNTNEAAAAWQAFLKVQPANAEAYAHLGFLAAQQEHYREAVPLYKKAMTLSPSMPGLKMNLGLALFKAGDLKEAIQTFGPILKSQSPNSPEAQRLKTLMGLAYYGQQDYAAAVPFLKEATAGDPQNLPFRLFLAHSCLGSKQYQCVLDVYREILNLNAESAEADMLAGEALDEMNDREGATQQFRAAVKANPQEPNVHFGLGYLLWTQSQYEEAAQEFQAELVNVPNNMQAMVYLGDSYIKMSNPDAALPFIQKALQIDPHLELAHLDMGIMHADAGRKEEALREFKTAVQLNPNDVNVHWRLARLYQSMGKKQEAAAEFAKTKSLTKAADDSVFSKLKKSDQKAEPVPETSGTVKDK